jgi:hypothetical protein
MEDKTNVIECVCNFLSQADLLSARNVINSNYKHIPTGEYKSRNYNHSDKLKVFVRDGFIDRYSGKRLVFPPVLKIISSILSEDFPYHPNWRLDKCHIGYWELIPTIDHIMPVSRGGKDEFDNWVCTSQLRNSIKSNWLLEEIGWQLHEPGDLNKWDGMFYWFVEYIKENQGYLSDTYIKSWHKAIINSHLI